MVPPFISIPVLAPTLPLQIKSPPLIAAPKQDPAFFSITTLPAGKVVIEKNAGSCFGAAIRGGDLICKGSVGARTGIDMKGGTIIIGGDAGAFTGFMMQRGRIIILGNVGINLGDSMYDGTIFVGGEIGSYGSDAVDAELTKSDQDWPILITFS